ncbi:MAG: alpha-ketoacid dehydrogenase subunit beta [Pseudodesulfovibrio sp.]|jgi:pyruvate dehydrogenase E1 component beta subunit|uniref:Pyruvate dehydrogenase E1 component beta subunit n=1 Tax=Pseudodesulfovibrio indicus TaxID=1716143 RepID=A0AA94PM68_9BACT|nr:transketolase C-terminal domain-containing protein [Pseudodesulfovibrio indicus]TDT89905.1 pyruvate dehydrogenase E1 component beta subunit [Pseudodesulfovibrio indicus]
MPWTAVCISKDDSLRFEKDGLRCISYVEALNEAQRQAMEGDPEVFLIGEGIDDVGGVFGSTKGLKDRFGERVMDMPIAENGLTGVVTAAAAAGMKPVLVHMRADFLPMSMDQLTNHAAKWHYMSGGRVSIPLVVRSIIGRGWGSAAQHSQGTHNMFLSTPGLKIALPATPYDAKGLFLSAMQDPNPVLIFEHRWLYGSIGPVPEEPYAVPLGQAVVRRPGSDVTIVAVSHMLPFAMQAADTLAAEGVEAEVVDPRTIAPLDMETISASVGKTGRLVLCDVSCRTGGFAGEVVCRLAEENPAMLKAPVRRVSFPDLPTPCSPVLEEAYYPGAEDIAAAVRAVIS